jgi:AcrR family transcriptional regulator
VTAAGQSRERLLHAGRRTFTKRGYARSTTREIAADAGVAEALLYRHFGSKAKLFEQAVLEPFERLIDTYVEGLAEHGPADVEWLYGLLSENRELIMALLAAEAYEVDLSRTPELSSALERLQTVAEFELTGRGGSAVEMPVTFAMVFALAVFEDWLLPPGIRGSPERVTREMVELMNRGLTREGAEQR